MKTLNRTKWWIACLTSFCSLARLQADINPGSASNSWLNAWSFSDTNTWCSDSGDLCRSSTNIGSFQLGGLTSVVVDSTNTAWLQYNVYETSGTNNLAVDRG